MVSKFQRKIVFIFCKYKIWGAEIGLMRIIHINRKGRFEWLFQWMLNTQIVDHQGCVCRVVAGIAGAGFHDLGHRIRERVASRPRCHRRYSAGGPDVGPSKEGFDPAIGSLSRRRRGDAGHDGAPGQYLHGVLGGGP